VALAISSDAVRRELARRARERADPLALHDRLRGRFDAASVISVLQQAFGLAPIATSDDALALTDLHARLLASHSRSVREAIARVAAERPVEAWLPLLRGHGLGATAAALHLRERRPAWEATEIAVVLRDAGYGDDDVLRALLENGVGSASSLRLLGENGWSADRMVASLLRRGVLLPEVRDHLRALGLRDAAIVDVLLRHAEAELVSLVMR
jgi:hypothetical protein